MLCSLPQDEKVSAGMEDNAPHPKKMCSTAASSNMPMVAPMVVNLLDDGPGSSMVQHQQGGGQQQEQQTLQQLQHAFASQNNLQQQQFMQQAFMQQQHAASPVFHGAGFPNPGIAGQMVIPMGANGQMHMQQAPQHQQQHMMNGGGDVQIQYLDAGNVPARSNTRYNPLLPDGR